VLAERSLDRIPEALMSSTRVESQPPEAPLQVRPTRTFGEVVSEAIADERRAIRTYASHFIANVRSMQAHKRVTAAEADMLCRRIESFAEGIAQGLHVGSHRHG
jgi:hypothetical protein